MNPKAAKLIFRAWFGLRGYYAWTTLWRRLTERQAPHLLREYGSVEELSARLRETRWTQRKNKSLLEVVPRPESVERRLRRGGPGVHLGDCLPDSSVLLRSDYELVRLSDINVGEKIAGRNGEWAEVEGWADKGVLDMLAIELNNCSTLRCTPDHLCILADGSEIHAGDLKPGMVLAEAKGIQRGDRWALPGWSRFTGLYIADGWIDRNGGIGRPRTSVAGRDGHPKEAQKKWIAELYARAGIQHSVAYKDIRTPDETVLAIAESCGCGAINKRIPKLDLHPSELAQLLDGVAADASKTTNRNPGRPHVPTRTYNTISPTLALQLRIAHRMLGQSTSIRRVDDHGGFGENPIYRITPRVRVTKPPKVKSIKGSVPQRAIDIKTSNGGIYLPEADVVVHNCDEHAIYAVDRLADLARRDRDRGMRPMLMTVGWIDEDGARRLHNMAIFYDTERRCWCHLSNWWQAVPQRGYESPAQIAQSVVKYGGGGTLIGWACATPDLQLVDIGP